MTTTMSGPGVDPELADLLQQLPEAPALDEQTLPLIRPYAVVPAETALAGVGVDRRDVTVIAPDGVEIAMTVLSPVGHDRTTVPAPCVYWVHGGGMVMGDRFSQIDMPLEWLTRFGAVVVTVDYRLAPEATGLTLVEDAYAGLRWTHEHAEELGVDPERLVIAGVSAGGGIAAGCALLARDRGGPVLAAQVLTCPMLDHRNDTVSSRQNQASGVWSRAANAFGWRSVLGDLAGAAGSAVSGYVSPSVAADLSGLPPTYVDVGSAEVFRDEDVAYATRIWEAGGQAELHVWAGGVHGFDTMFPEARISATARQARSDWLGRALRATR
jgi:acetyl esterase/lipase